MLNPSPAPPASKSQDPQNMDALCKLLLSDFKVKDDQDYIIDEIVAAFDRQNFTNKGFLAKVSDQQHKYLVRIVPKIALKRKLRASIQGDFNCP